MFRQYFVANGVPCVVAHPDSLTYDGKRLRAEDGREGGGAVRGPDEARVLAHLRLRQGVRLTRSPSVVAFATGAATDALARGARRLASSQLFKHQR